MAKDGVLVLNAGSSSLKFAVFQVTSASGDESALFRGQVSGIGSAPVFSVSPETTCTNPAKSIAAIHNHRDAIDFALDWITRCAGDVRLLGVGHRVVHGGPERRRPALVTPDLLGALDVLSSLAPHHQPHNLAAIRAVAAAAPDLPQVACFDTAFHATQDPVARLLPLPKSLREQGLQRYGFHGLSYEYITAAAPAFNGGCLPERMVIAHLGNGASVCAVRDGNSVATSMGFSTLDGLLMGTRSGGIDPGVLLHLMRAKGMDEAALSRLLYNESGLLGVSGISADMRVLLADRTPEAGQAVDLFVYTLVRAIGSMAAALEGVDALVFTGGIGEHADEIRRRVCDRLGWLGVNFDPAANEAHGPLISTSASRVGVWVIPTNEERVIVRHTLAKLAEPSMP